MKYAASSTVQFVPLAKSSKSSPSLPVNVYYSCDNIRIKANRFLNTNIFRMWKYDISSIKMELKLAQHREVDTNRDKSCKTII